MSPSQVVKIVKGSHHNQDGGHLGYGAKELIRLDDFRVVNGSFTVRFYFIDDKLIQVTLSLNNERSFSSILVVFDSLTDVIGSKYGKEISRDIYSHSSFLKKAVADWINGKVNINMTVMTVGDAPAFLNLNYQTRLSTEAEKP